MSELMHAQTVASEQEYLLTKEAYKDWVVNQDLRELWLRFRDSDSEHLHHLYLKEHGLPLDSTIEGL